MTEQRIILGDCLDAFANERNVPAFVSDPPANIEFMGRSWDGSEPELDYVPMIPARDKAHLRELQIEHSFSRYWAKRYAMAYDIADQHAVNIVWTLPRTSHQTANALRAAGWRIKDNLVHLFGTGWAKSGNALAPGQEGWILATKGKPDLVIDACRVPRGERDLRVTAEHDYKGATYGDRKGCKAAGKTSDGSLPKNALLSHCEECVRVGVKRVKGAPGGNPTERTNGAVYSGTDQRRSTISYAPDGTESVPAWHCLAGCVCGARSKWDPEKPLPRCPCGETWRWLCAVAEVNVQSGSGGSGSGVQKISVGRGGGWTGQGVAAEGLRDFGDQGGASRFFNTFSYLSKCSSSERHAGCESLFWKANKKNPFGFDQVTKEEWESLAPQRIAPSQDTPRLCLNGQIADNQRAQGNVHPTVKSYRLMHWLHSITGVKRVLDFTAGSGTGMYTSYLDDVDWLGAEICPEAIVIAKARLAFWKGLSFDARDAFMLDDIVPIPEQRDARALTLFD